MAIAVFSFEDTPEWMQEIIRKAAATTGVKATIQLSGPTNCGVLRLEGDDIERVLAACNVIANDPTLARLFEAEH